MSERPRSHNNLTIDIESWGGSKRPTAADVKVPVNYTKPEAIQRHIDKHLPLQHNKQALMSLKGEIACIGLALNDDPVEVLYRNGSEEALMKQFVTWLVDQGINEMTQVYWVGKNLYGFDLPWLLHRAWKYNLPLLSMLIPRKKYDEHIVDIQLIFAGTDTQTRYSLEDIAEYFNIPCKEGMHGADVPQAYLDGRHEEIAAYCAQDIESERAIAKLLKPEIW